MYSGSGLNNPHVLLIEGKDKFVRLQKLNISLQNLYIELKLS
jgi:hypothetical protein